MSFSGDVKEELVKQLGTARHCQIAELSAILEYSQAVKQTDSGENYIEISEENQYLSAKCAVILRKLFDCRDIRLEDKAGLCCTDKNFVDNVLLTIKHTLDDNLVSPIVMKSQCCKRAFLRGAFLSMGSMSNPEKEYHLEFVCESMRQALQIQNVLLSFDLDAKVVTRKKYQVLYIKESEIIVELLNIMGAHISLMNLENIRILKDMRNSINRRVNCETANINKTVSAATKQIDDIIYLREHHGFEKLSDNLREIAEVRLEYPDASLKELGEYLDPPVGKSGVNHRLRKLSEFADKLRVERGEDI